MGASRSGRPWRRPVPPRRRRPKSQGLPAEGTGSNRHRAGVSPHNLPPTGFAVLPIGPPPPAARHLFRRRGNMAPRRRRGAVQVPRGGHATPRPLYGVCRPPRAPRPRRPRPMILSPPQPLLPPPHPAHRPPALPAERDPARRHAARPAAGWTAAQSASSGGRGSGPRLFRHFGRLPLNEPPRGCPKGRGGGHAMPRSHDDLVGPVERSHEARGSGHAAPRPPYGAL